MKILRWTIAATIVVGYGAASAADLQPHMATKAPPVIAPTTSWTGFYAGANLGWGFSSDPSVNFSANGGNLASFVGPPPSVNFSAAGPLGGAQVGYIGSPASRPISTVPISTAVAIPLNTIRELHRKPSPPLRITGSIGSARPAAASATCQPIIF